MFNYPDRPLDNMLDKQTDQISLIIERQHLTWDIRWESYTPGPSWQRGSDGTDMTEQPFQDNRDRKTKTGQWTLQWQDKSGQDIQDKKTTVNRTALKR